MRDQAQNQDDDDDGDDNAVGDVDDNDDVKLGCVWLRLVACGAVGCLLVCLGLGGLDGI